MSDRCDTPRGPTATELHRRTISDTHPESTTRGETMAPRQSGPAGDGSPGRTAEQIRATLAPVIELRRCDYCGSPSPHGCQNGPCSFHGRAG